MAVGLYSGYGDREVRFDELEPYDLWKDFPDDIATIVDGQLEGYGYSYASYEGRLVRIDLCYSNDGTTEIFFCNATDLLEDAIEYRTELMEEEYGDEFDEGDECVIELRRMEEFWRNIQEV